MMYRWRWRLPPATLLASHLLLAIASTILLTMQSVWGLPKCTAMGLPCSLNADCVLLLPTTQTNDSTTPAKACRCRSGFHGNGTHCENIDECVVTRCHSNATCIDTSGSYECRCASGFHGSGLHCEDVDECVVVTTGITDGDVGDDGINRSDTDAAGGSESICPVGSVCINKIGSYRCKCKTGYELVSNGTACDVSSPNGNAGGSDGKLELWHHVLVASLCGVLSFVFVICACAVIKQVMLYTGSRKPAPNAVPQEADCCNDAEWSGEDAEGIRHQPPPPRGFEPHYNQILEVAMPAMDSAGDAWSTHTELKPTKSSSTAASGRTVLSSRWSSRGFLHRNSTLTSGLSMVNPPPMTLTSKHTLYECDPDYYLSGCGPDSFLGRPRLCTPYMMRRLEKPLPPPIDSLPYSLSDSEFANPLRRSWWESSESSGSSSSSDSDSADKFNLGDDMSPNSGSTAGGSGAGGYRRLKRVVKRKVPSPWHSAPVGLNLVPSEYETIDRGSLGYRHSTYDRRAPLSEGSALEQRRYTRSTDCNFLSPGGVVGGDFNGDFQHTYHLMPPCMPAERRALSQSCTGSEFSHTDVAAHNMGSCPSLRRRLSRQLAFRQQPLSRVGGEDAGSANNEYELCVHTPRPRLPSTPNLLYHAHRRSVRDSAVFHFSSTSSEGEPDCVRSRSQQDCADASLGGSRDGRMMSLPSAEPRTSRRRKAVCSQQDAACAANAIATIGNGYKTVMSSSSQQQQRVQRPIPDFTSPGSSLTSRHIANTGVDPAMSAEDKSIEIIDSPSKVPIEVVFSDDCSTVSSRARLNSRSSGQLDTDENANSSGSDDAFMPSNCGGGVGSEGGAGGGGGGKRLSAAYAVQGQTSRRQRKVRQMPNSSHYVNVSQEEEQSGTSSDIVALDTDDVTSDALFDSCGDIERSWYGSSQCSSVNLSSASTLPSMEEIPQECALPSRRTSSVFRLVGQVRRSSSAHSSSVCLSQTSSNTHSSSVRHSQSTMVLAEADLSELLGQERQSLCLVDDFLKTSISFAVLPSKSEVVATNPTVTSLCASGGGHDGMFLETARNSTSGPPTPTEQSVCEDRTPQQSVSGSTCFNTGAVAHHYTDASLPIFRPAFHSLQQQQQNVRGVLLRNSSPAVADLTHLRRTLSSPTSSPSSQASHCPLNGPTSSTATLRATDGAPDLCSPELSETATCTAPTQATLGLPAARDQLALTPLLSLQPTSTAQYHSNLLDQSLVDSGDGASTTASISSRSQDAGNSSALLSLDDAAAQHHDGAEPKMLLQRRKNMSMKLLQRRCGSLKKKVERSLTSPGVSADSQLHCILDDARHETPEEETAMAAATASDRPSTTPTPTTRTTTSTPATTAAHSASGRSLSQSSSRGSRLKKKFRRSLRTSFVRGSSYSWRVGVSPSGSFAMLHARENTSVFDEACHGTRPGFKVPRRSHSLADGYATEAFVTHHTRRYDLQQGQKPLDFHLAQLKR
ncbi:uncharacterized protein LOC135825981 isoform X2 [Sycon ciliatum]|uniref:uncharacterized protein LOC135825981 isoform X2 n=1 Tax=Sycon ciliatum TaxID=27933 RepID=UPI0031F61B9D